MNISFNWLCASIKWLRKSWIGESIGNAFVSAIVAAVVGITTAYYWDMYQESKRHKSIAFGRTNGEDYPAQLFRNAIDEGYKIEFKPLELKQVKVCEYLYLRGRTWEELVFKYLDRYKDCFIVTDIEEKHIRITPNNFSGFLKYDENNKSYSCKCF